MTRRRRRCYDILARYLLFPLSSPLSLSLSLSLFLSTYLITQQPVIYVSIHRFFSYASYPGHPIVVLTPLGFN